MRFVSVTERGDEPSVYLHWEPTDVVRLASSYLMLLTVRHFSHDLLRQVSGGIAGVAVGTLAAVVAEVARVPSGAGAARTGARAAAGALVAAGTTAGAAAEAAGGQAVAAVAARAPITAVATVTAVAGVAAGTSAESGIGVAGVAGVATYHQGFQQTLTRA